jgi:hypothetical protein
VVVSRSTNSDAQIPSELRLLWALIDRHAGSSRPSRAEVERGIESGLGRLMLLEARLRKQASRASGTRLRDAIREDHDLVEEIRALREAVTTLVTELRARTNSGEYTVVRGFVFPRRPVLGGGGYPLTN